MKRDRLTVTLNEKLVIDNAQLPGFPAEGPIALFYGGDNMDLQCDLILDVEKGTMGAFERLIRASDLQQRLQQTCAFGLLLGYGCASASIISPLLTSISVFLTIAYKATESISNP